MRAGAASQAREQAISEQTNAASAGARARAYAQQPKQIWPFPCERLVQTPAAQYGLCTRTSAQQPVRNRGRRARNDFSEDSYYKGPAKRGLLFTDRARRRRFCTPFVQAVVSHRSAAALYGLGHLPADRHEFTRRSGASRAEPMCASTEAT